jgi:hypothetical protein
MQARMVAEVLRGGAGPVAQRSIVEALAEAKAADGADGEQPRSAATAAAAKENKAADPGQVAGSGSQPVAAAAVTAAAEGGSSSPAVVERPAVPEEGGSENWDGKGREAGVDVDPVLVQKFLQTKEESLKLLLEDFGGQVRYLRRLKALDAGFRIIVAFGPNGLFVRMSIRLKLKKR